MTASAFAPGKLILMGEHAVVYGHPALAIAIDRGMTVDLHHRAGPSGLDTPWVEDSRLHDALLEILPPNGVSVRIESTLPVGRGMGSSAALAVALVRAAARLDGREASMEEINTGAFRVERIFHGNPSGIDHTVSMRGGALRYRRTPKGPQFESVQLAPLPLVVIDSGSAGNTSEMVASVRSRKPDIDKHLEAMATLLTNTLPMLIQGKHKEVGRAWCENHRLLQAIGVSTPTLDAIVDLSIDNGAWGAKLAGAGGGGVVIVLTEQPENLIKVATAQGFQAFKTQSAIQ
jgi:mevalonate kinase